MAHQTALRPDPRPRPQPVETPSGKKHSGRVSDTSNHLSELTATLAANGGGDSSSDLALDLVLNEIVEQARLTTSASGAAIALERNGEMGWRASSGESAPELGISVDTISGLAADCVNTQRAQCCDNADLDVRVDAGACRLLGVRSIVLVPVSEGERVIGLLEALSPRAAAFSAREVQSLQILTRRIIENVKQAEQVRAESFDQLEAQIEPDRQAELPVVNFEPEPDKPHWFKRDLLTGVLTGVVILLAGLLGWMVGRAGWDMAVRSSDAQLTASSMQPSTEESADPPAREIANPQKREKKKAEKAAVAEPINSAPIEPTTLESSAPETHTSTASAKPAVVKPDSNPSGKSAVVEPPIGGLVVYEKGKVVYRSPLSQPNQISADAGDNALVHRVEPEYPEQARQSGIEGAVVLKVLVGADGAVENVHTVSGNAQLASAAEYAVRQWRFRPLVANGHPAEFETHVTVNFAHP